MEVAVQKISNLNEKTAMETLFSYLDRGIDDVEAGRLHTVDEAFQIIKDKLKNGL